MKDVYISGVGEKEDNSSHPHRFVKDYIWAPIRSGCCGFAMFFTILLAVKLFSYIIGTYNFFAVELTDLSLSSIGFVLLFLIRELENFKEADT
jgi:hypothetical protein